MATDPHLSKRSRTEKMVNPFNCAGVLEVYFKDEWYRVTSKYFRSFSGQRRITSPDSVVHGLAQLSVPLTTKEYDGPVFYMDTNYLYEDEVINDFVSRDKIN